MAPVNFETGANFQIVKILLEPPGEKVLGQKITIGAGEREHIGYRKIGRDEQIHWVGWVEGIEKGGYVDKTKLEPGDVIRFPPDTEPVLTATGT